MFFFLNLSNDFYRTKIAKFFEVDENYGKGAITTGMVFEMIFSVSNLILFCFEDKNIHSRVYYF